MSAKERAEQLAAILEDLAGQARSRVLHAAASERAAFNVDDEPVRAEAEARAYVARGEALAYDSAAVRVRLLAAGIPEETC